MPVGLSPVCISWAHGPRNDCQHQPPWPGHTFVTSLKTLPCLSRRVLAELLIHDGGTTSDPWGLKLCTTGSACGIVEASHRPGASEPSTRL